MNPALALGILRAIAIFISGHGSVPVITDVPDEASKVQALGILRLGQEVLPEVLGETDIQRIFQVARNPINHEFPSTNPASDLRDVGHRIGRVHDSRRDTHAAGNAVSDRHSQCHSLLGNACLPEEHLVRQLFVRCYVFPPVLAVPGRISQRQYRDGQHEYAQENSDSHPASRGKASCLCHSCTPIDSILSRATRPVNAAGDDTRAQEAEP